MTVIPASRAVSSSRNRVSWAVMALLSLGVALASSRYLAGVGPVPENIAANPYRHPWLIIHIGAAMTALAVAPLQFLPRLRARIPKLHRWLGRVYAVACLVGGVCGFVLALGSSTGPVSTVGFGILSIVWIVTTAQGWRYALQRNFVTHRAWMIRSFALTFAAVTLRLYLPLLFLLPIRFEDGYRAISFLCWVPNLALAELYLRRKRLT